MLAESIEKKPGFPGSITLLVILQFPIAILVLCLLRL